MGCMRTSQQNRAMHQYFNILADELNAAGYSVQEVLAQAVDREWTPAGVKDNLWRPIQIAMTDKKSTTELGTAEVSEIYEVLNRHTCGLFGIGVQFPDQQG